MPRWEEMRVQWLEGLRQEVGPGRMLNFAAPFAPQPKGLGHHRKWNAKTFPWAQRRAGWALLRSYAKFMGLPRQRRGRSPELHAVQHQGV